jgi:hypothetical protein
MILSNFKGTETGKVSHWFPEVHMINFQEEGPHATKNIAGWESKLISASHQKTSKYPTMHVALLWLTDDCILQLCVMD